MTRVKSKGREMLLRGKATIKLAILISMASWLPSTEGSAQTLICGSTPAPAHNNGFGGLYYSCLPKGPPFTAAMATAAAQAWAASNGGSAITISSVQCTGGGSNLAVVAQGGTQCPVWNYSGSHAGYAMIGPSCFCPGSNTSYPWN